MSEIAIRVQGLSKRYRIGQREPYRALRDVLARGLTAPFRATASVFRRSGPKGNGIREKNYIWALKDVSFEVKRGEVVGIIGRNGAGKSTLLKILSRITEPTEGYAEIHGRVGSLLEVGTGFHPELTGRENIYLNGAILGMKKHEIDRKFDEIVAFAEIEKFIDTPVKYYSSGMYVRLAFAVAAHLEPEILLVDEVLAVGDAAFQKKCLGKMGDVAKEGRTVLFVSHNMGAISQLCNQGICIEGGEVIRSGRISDVITSYLSAAAPLASEWQNPSPPLEGQESEIFIKSVSILSGDAQPAAVTPFASSITIKILYKLNQALRNLSIICRVTDLHGNVIMTTWDTDSTEWRHRVREPGHYQSLCEVPGKILRPGKYFLSVGAHVNNVKTICYYDQILSFEVSEDSYSLNPDRIGIITPLLPWEVHRITCE